MDRSNGDFERRAQSVVQLIISAMLVWIGFTVVDMGKSVVRLEERSAQTTQAITDLKVTAAALSASNAATAAAVAAAANVNAARK